MYSQNECFFLIIDVILMILSPWLAGIAFWVPTIAPPTGWARQKAIIATSIRSTPKRLLLRYIQFHSTQHNM